LSRLFQKRPDEDRSPALLHEPASVVTPIAMQRTSERRRPEGLAPRALIAAGINILGCLQTDGEIEIDGEINGDVRCAHLTIGRSGTVNGDITGKEIIIRGTVNGAIQAERVIIQEGAHVEGDIRHTKFAIEEGAYFKGSCIPSDAQEADAAASTAAQLNGGEEEGKAEE
jgi:cytoskeletal protein CcmA (bactofilin family)